jgi:SAM-dependent methyltransferase
MSQRGPAWVTPPLPAASDAEASTIRKVVADLQAEAAQSSAANDRRRLARQLHAHLAPSRYDQAMSAAFAAEFLTTNFDKFFEVVRSTPLEAPRSVLDLGAGGGAFTAALVAALGPRSVDVKRLVLLDRSRPQLDLTGRLLGRMLRLDWARQGLDLRQAVASSLQYVLSDFVVQGADLGERFDLILAGHVVTENPERRDATFAAIAPLLATNGAVLLVEQFDDPLWPTLPQLATRHGFLVSAQQHSTVQLSRERPHSLKWAVLRRRRDWRRALLDKYFTAWHRQDEQLLAEVFAEDATYHEKPFDEPIHGLEAIRRYWREQAQLQRSPQPELVRVLIQGNNLLAEWRTVFARDGGSERTEVRGVLWCVADKQARRLVAFSEVFRSRDL